MTDSVEVDITCVATTSPPRALNALASRFTTGKISDAEGTGRDPVSMKSFCTSTRIKAVFLSCCKDNRRQWKGQ